MDVMSLIDDDSKIIRDMFQTNGIYTLFSTISMSFKDVKDIECRVNNKRQTLNITATNRLKILKYFIIHNECMKPPLRINDWLSIDSDQFIDFLISYQEIEHNVDVPSKSTSYPIYPTKSTVASKYDPLEQFTRSIKRDTKAFPQLKDYKQWDTWYLATKSQTRIRDISEVLDPLYVPTSHVHISLSDKLLPMKINDICTLYL